MSETRSDQIKSTLLDVGEIMSPAQIADKLGLSASYTRGILIRMVKRGDILRYDNGQYILPEWVDRYPELAERQSIKAEVSGNYPKFGGNAKGVVSAPGMAMIPLIKVTASAGPGDFPFTEEIESYLALSNVSVKREFGVAADRLAIITASGNSMQSTINPGDKLWIVFQNGDPLIDTAVYIFRLNGVILVKRYFATVDKSVKICGDNPSETPLIINDPSVDFAVIAKVARIEKPA